MEAGVVFQDDELRVDHQVAPCHYTIDYNVHDNRADHKYSTGVLSAPVVDRTAAVVSEGQHDNHLLVLVR